MMSGNYHVEPISGNYKGVFGKDGEQLCAVYGWKSEERAALIVTAVNAFEPMKEALRELEAANDTLCAIRSQAAYDQMIADGNGDALARLDRGRLNARAAPRLAEGEKE
jgi:hypothetical protein